MTCTERKLSTEVSIPFKVTIIDIVILMQNLIVVTANGGKNIHRKEKKCHVLEILVLNPPNAESKMAIRETLFNHSPILILWS